MKQPCKQDCPRRSAECRKTCPDWVTYEAAKRKEYTARQDESMIREAMYKADRRRTKVGCYLGSERKRHSGD